MDPYLEEHWGDVPTSIAAYARDSLQAQLPDDLVARVEEHVALDIEEDEDPVGYFPDVRVEEFPNGHVNATADTASPAVAERIRIKRSPLPRTRRSVIIERRSGHRIVTAIEILSPGNKRGAAARAAYRKKRDEFVESGISVVEIDLIRAGQPVLPIPASRIPPKFRGPYRICVVRSWLPGEVELYRVSLRQALPVVQVPLRKKDPEVPLDLQALIDHAYASGRYDRTDYRQEPDPPLTKQDADWADRLLKENGLR